MSCLRAAAIMAVGILAAIFFVDLCHTHVFEPEVLQKLANEAIDAHGTNISAIVVDLVDRLSKVPGYGSHMTAKQEWIFNNAGGAMGSLYIIHASLSEYLIIFGTAVGTEGHTGRFMATDYFTILEGEQWAYSAGEYERTVYKPGEMHVLPQGEAQQYRIPDHAWGPLEYARGQIWLMMPFGVADTFTSTIDFHTLLRTFWVYGKATVFELLQFKV